MGHPDLMVCLVLLVVLIIRPTRHDCRGTQGLACLGSRESESLYRVQVSRVYSLKFGNLPPVSGPQEFRYLKNPNHLGWKR